MPLYATQRYKPALWLDACANDSRDVAVLRTTSGSAATTSTSGSWTRYHVISPGTLIGLACTTHSSDTRDVSFTTCCDETFTISAATVTASHRPTCHTAHTMLTRPYAPNQGLECNFNEAEDPCELVGESQFCSTCTVVGLYGICWIIVCCLKRLVCKRFEAVYCVT